MQLLSYKISYVSWSIIICNRNDGCRFSILVEQPPRYSSAKVKNVQKASGWVPYFRFPERTNEHGEMKLRLREQDWIALLVRRLGVIAQGEGR